MRACTGLRRPIRCAVVITLAAGLLVLAGEVLAQQPPAGVLDQVALDYQLASRTWIARILAVTTNLFFWLALLEFVVAGIMYMIAAPQARDGIAGRFLVKIMLISFVYMSSRSPTTGSRG